MKICAICNCDMGDDIVIRISTGEVYPKEEVIYSICDKCLPKRKLCDICGDAATSKVISYKCMRNINTKEEVIHDLCDRCRSDMTKLLNDQRSKLSVISLKEYE